MAKPNNYIGLFVKYFFVREDIVTTSASKKVL